MTTLSAVDLLSQPELVLPVAPWCRRLDNLELGILLLCQPLDGSGLRCAELEHRLGRLASDLPFGPVYFQRVKRAVGRLEEDGSLRQAAPSGRRYTLAPGGLAALVLNLQVLEHDPTLDGSELELKRALVVRWNLLFRELQTLPESGAIADPAAGFFEEAGRLEVFGQPVLTPEVIDAALDPLHLLAVARERVDQLRQDSETRLARARTLAAALASPTAGRRTPSTVAAVTARLATALELATQVERYRSFAAYLERLRVLLVAELPVVDLRSLRRLLTGDRR